MSRQGAPNKKQASWEEGHRECVACKQMLPFSMFHRHKQCLHGVNTVCKSCRVNLSKKQWKDKDVKLKILQRTKTRASMHNVEFNLTLEDIYIPAVCPVFKTPFIYGDVDKAASIDKVDPSKGYVSGNVRIISNKANRMKSNATNAELKQFAEWVLKYD